MIDFGLTKLMLIGAVALIVVGPEKLPKVARMAGSLFGRAQRYLNELKSEVSREIELDELHKLRKEMEDATTQARQAVSSTLSHAESDLNSVWREVSGTPPHSIQTATMAPNADPIARKAKDFRKKRMLRNSAIPSWYKHRTGHKMRVISAAGRVAKYRTGAKLTFESR